ncbi:hypothetical protein HQ346_17010 [Rhodococcus sp. BP-252]|uniref:hypothetical protein n=1 Tax=unclassified Rhodococcus (in: high G+C Gram-positive bacteria) TaxID=192944 RepID=UPI001C9BA870|nr:MULTISPECIES: hypothetical protein [unclassified Rhodococcus (in: high G+C Gram-positive bacteria)]MBY6413397.1 hypothetical protein [Rhodococcus sp. BP-320]MBY6417999.1 hypothetical protein [Rhodococcus sp. BP-321]MBY6422311.1 hypothetical protein [Rhodococcus sp. BP-324]MBY6428048.1 hypothetical protein [Rhodococcus sp. BP-323]MBY6433318.1 hypothetical protein [Rhodococcus sp. BP-322]
MRIRTLIGPPLQQEIVRSTAVAIALSNPDPDGGSSDRLPSRTLPRPGRPTDH